MKYVVTAASCYESASLLLEQRLWSWHRQTGFKRKKIFIHHMWPRKQIISGMPGQEQTWTFFPPPKIYLFLTADFQTKIADWCDGWWSKDDDCRQLLFSLLFCQFFYLTVRNTKTRRVHNKPANVWPFAWKVTETIHSWWVLFLSIDQFLQLCHSQSKISIWSPLWG